MSSKNAPDRITKIQYQRYLDDLGFPEGEKPTGKSYKNGKTLYGQWLKRTDPIRFDVQFNEWRRAEEYKRERKII